MSADVYTLRKGLWQTDRLPDADVQYIKSAVIIRSNAQL